MTKAELIKALEPYPDDMRVTRLSLMTWIDLTEVTKI